MRKRIKMFETNMPRRVKRSYRVGMLVWPHILCLFMDIGSARPRGMLELGRCLNMQLRLFLQRKNRAYHVFSKDSSYYT